MEQEHINNDLLRKIQENLRAVKPRGRWYGRAINVARLSLIALFVFISTLAMSLFLYDLGEKTNIFEFTQSPIIENVANFIFEFLIISLLGVGGFYLMYRQTDWVLVKERLWLFIGAFIIIAGASVGLVLFSESDIDPWGDFIGDTTHEVSRLLPFRGAMEERMETGLEENSYFRGSIVSVKKSEHDALITIQYDKKTGVFRIVNDKGNYLVGDRVIIQFSDEHDGSEPEVIGIRKI